MNNVNLKNKLVKLNEGYRKLTKLSHSFDKTEYLKQDDSLRQAGELFIKFYENDFLKNYDTKNNSKFREIDFDLSEYAKKTKQYLDIGDHNYFIIMFSHIGDNCTDKNSLDRIIERL
jgi:hypothetical protein